MSERGDRMMQTAPTQYQFSKIYAALQQAYADGYDGVYTDNEDLRNQLYISTATWGLKYYEELFGLPTIETDSYEIRRSRVLSSCRGIGNLSAAYIKSVCEAYANSEVDVSIRPADCMVTIAFVGIRGIPPNMADLEQSVQNIIHAHLGVEYSYRFMTWDEYESYNHTLDEWDALNLTWDELETYREVV